MKTFISHGHTLEITAGADIASGSGVLQGAIFGVAAHDIANGAQGTLNLSGVYALAKAPSQPWSVGAKVYWDSTNARCTTAAAGNTLIGVAAAPVAGGAGDTLGQVRLNATAA